MAKRTRIPASTAARLRAEQALFIRELKDGCNNCRAARGLCGPHKGLALQVWARPREIFNIEGGRIVRLVEPGGTPPPRPSKPADSTVFVGDVPAPPFGTPFMTGEDPSN